MDKHSILFWRNFFLRLFLITAFVAAFIFTVTEVTKEWMMATLQLSEAEFKRDVMNSMVILRVLLMFILVPLIITFQTFLNKK